MPHANRTRSVAVAAALSVALIAISARSNEASAPAGAATATITVEIKGLRSDKGLLGVELYDNADGFPTAPKKAKAEIWSPIKEGSATVEFKNMPYGWYAVAVCHDENANRKCDANFLGIPKEGIAASNGAHRANMIPKFAKAKFAVYAADVKTAIVDIKY